MSKITKSAKGEQCTLRIPGVCEGRTETVVFCHAPYPNRGGMRDQDFWGAYGCVDCHDFVDGRVDNLVGFHMTAVYWMPAIHETQMKLHEKGLLWLGGDYENKILPRRV